MKNNFTEIIIAVCLIILSILLLNPFHFWMGDMLVMSILVTTLILFGIFASFILREKVSDERDEAHRSLAGRNAFLAGTIIIILGIIVQGYSHSVDVWLVIALTIMIIVKIITRIWSDRNF